MCNERTNTAISAHLTIAIIIIINNILRIGGLSPWLMPEAERISFEGNLVKTKIALEDAFFAVAKASKVPSIIICDRGTMDTSAYLDRDTWEVVMDEFGWNVVDLRDK